MQKKVLIKIEKLESNKGQITGVNMNPRDLTKEQFEQTVKSIKDFPEMLEARTLIVVEQNNQYVVIGGNQRLQALKYLNYKQIPCIVVDWSVEKINQFIIKDNVSYGSWDWDLLANEWEIEKLEQWGLDLPFSNVDYGLLDEDDEDIDSQMEQMQENVKRAIQIEFNADDFAEAKKLVKYYREHDQYIGGLLIQALRDAKNEIKS